MNHGMCYVSTEFHVMQRTSAAEVAPFDQNHWNISTEVHFHVQVYTHTHTYIAIRLIWSVCSNCFNWLSNCSKRIIDGNNETTRVRLLTVTYPSCCKLSVTRCIFCLQNWPCIVLMKPLARITHTHTHTLLFTDMCMLFEKITWYVTWMI